MTQKEVAKMIDHTILRANATKDEIQILCEEALQYNFASVCINPSFVPFASKLLEKSDVKTCTVIGFPLGATATDVKVFEAKWSLEHGAEEVDMVINIGELIKGNLEYVREDIRSVVEVTKQTNKDAIVKVIIETCLLTEEEKKQVTHLCLEGKADFIKTSTGFSTGGATVSDIELMKEIAQDHMLIKASGGVKTYQDFENMVKAGANRIGTSNGIAIVSEMKE